MALSWPSEQDREVLCPEDLGWRRVELKVWRRTERGLQVEEEEEEESVVFSNIEVRVKRAGPSGLGDLEVTEFIARIRSGPFEREEGAFAHLATAEARFMPDQQLPSLFYCTSHMLTVFITNPFTCSCCVLL